MDHMRQEILWSHWRSIKETAFFKAKLGKGKEPF